MTPKPKPVSQTDAELLERAYGGDRAALGHLYDRHAQAVYGFIRRMASREEAEDVVQSTFIRLVEIAGSFDARSGSARAWIFGVAYRVASERRRKLSRLRALIATLALRESQEPQAPRAEHAVDLERALGRLSEEKRVVLLLTQVHGFSSEETAAILELPVGTVWTRLHHARRELREILGDAT